MDPIHQTFIFLQETVEVENEPPWFLVCSPPAWGFCFLHTWTKPPPKKKGSPSRRIHVWYIYLLVHLVNVGKYIPYMDFFWAWLKMKIKSKDANGTIYWTWFNPGTPNNLKIWNHPNWQPTILIRGCFRFQDGTTSWCSLVHVQYTNLPII